MNPVKDLASIYWDAVREVDPTSLIHSRVKKDGRTLVIHGQDTRISEDLLRYKRIIILGIGKASASMASAMESIIGNDLSKGLIITKYGHGLNLRKIKVMEAGHPIPDENSMEGARLLVQMASIADEHTLIINLISGGGSSLFCLPIDGISLEDKRKTTRILLLSGAAIDEINCIRKHISKVKGGGLAQIAHPARLINLILSDVIGDRIDTIASGITAPDPTTFNDALLILQKYHLEDKLPKTVINHLRLGAQGSVPETLKAGNPVFGNTVNIILGNNALACSAACRSAQKLGYDACILNTTLAGEASQAGACFSLLAKEIDADRSGKAKPAAIITGGETTVTIRGKGKGGRNQEMALAFASQLHRICPGSQNIFFLSAGTDGSDGPTDAAGAFVTAELMEKMKDISALASACLKENDAYHFFWDTGHLFTTGPTYTNVCDIQILIVV
ncbi:MAG: glycerate kinase [Smithella sp.]